MQGSPSSQMKQEKGIMLGKRRISLVQILRSLHSTKYIVPRHYNKTAGSGVPVPGATCLTTKALLASPPPPPHL